MAAASSGAIHPSILPRPRRAVKATASRDAAPGAARGRPTHRRRFDNARAPAYGVSQSKRSRDGRAELRVPSDMLAAPRSTTCSRRWAMAHGAFRVLDSDIHIIEPPDLWTRYIDREFRDRAPQGLTEFAGDLRLAREGQPWGRHPA